MKLKYLIILILLLIDIILISSMASCKSEPKKDSDYGKEEFNTNGIHVLTIDGCQYIWIRSWDASGLVHKENCTFCKKRTNGIHSR